jgi:hypothetical protein
MSLLSSFIASHLVPALENAFAAHEPEMQAALLNEIKELTYEVGAWIENKLTPATGIR